MHLSYFELCPVCACRSNFRVEAKGRNSRVSRNMNDKGAITNDRGVTIGLTFDRPMVRFDQRAPRLNLGKAPAREARSAPPTRREFNHLLNVLILINIDDASVT